MVAFKKTRYLIVGDRGISVEFGNSIEEEIYLKVQKMLFAIKKNSLVGIVDVFPCIRSLFVYYDPLKISLKELLKELKKIESRMTDITLLESILYEIPCLYGGEYGPDLSLVGKLLGLTPNEVIRIHSGREYLLYDTGFMGGSLKFKLPHPLDRLSRKEIPNLGVPAGAVLMAGGLGSSFKSTAAPTGWYWIGSTPIRAWFPEKNPPQQIVPGNKIIYRPINFNEYILLKEKTDKGQFLIKKLKAT